MTREARTDIHRPSAPEFDPESYDYLDAFDLNPEPGFGEFENQRRIARINKLIEAGRRFGGVNGLGQCDHCGARIRYAALLEHRGTKRLIWVGETCLDNRFSLSAPEFHRLRESARLNRERATKAEVQERYLESVSEDLRAAILWATSREEGWTYEYGIWTGPRDWEDLSAGERRDLRDKGWNIAADIARKIEEYGPLSPRQEALLLKLHREYRERQAQDAAKLEQVAAGKIEKCPAGRVKITGVIRSKKFVESIYGGALKIVVETPAGYRVYGTLPGAIYDALVGDTVEFTATVEPSQDDPLFGFYKRPTKPALLASAEDAEAASLEGTPDDPFVESAVAAAVE